MSEGRQVRGYSGGRSVGMVVFPSTPVLNILTGIEITPPKRTKISVEVVHKFTLLILCAIF